MECYNDEYFPTLPTDEIVTQEGFIMYLKKGAGRMKYEQIKSDIPNKGQRKLYLSILFFLIYVYSKLKENERVTILYIGAAPGSNIYLIDKTIYGIEWIDRWILYDKAEFDSRLSSDRFDIRHKYFTDSEAVSIKKNISGTLIYISDIRRAPNLPKSHKNYPQQMDNLIYGDILLDQGWLKIIKPMMWCLKFRMPYHTVIDDSGEYKNMSVIPGIYDFFQSWIGSGSTEIRRIGNRKNIEKYLSDPTNEEYIVDFETYEEQLQYYNAKQRNEIYLHNVRMKGLCFCHDCNFEIYIWKQKIMMFDGIDDVTTKDIIENIEVLDKYLGGINKLFTEKSTHGKYPNWDRKIRFKKLETERLKYKKK